MNKSMKMVVSEDFRSLIKGQSYNLHRGINLFLDDNGKGKSTLLAGLAYKLGYRHDFFTVTEDYINTELPSGYPKLIGYYSTERNSKQASHFGDNMTETLDCMFMSSGEATFKQIIAEMAGKIVIILDEPCNSLSIHYINRLIHIIKRILEKKPVKLFVIIEHNKQFLDAFSDEIYHNVNGDTGIVSDFIDEQMNRPIT